MATDDFRVSRRRFLRDAAIGAGAFAIAGRRAFGAFPQSAAPALPPPAQSGIEHIVVMMMENRSFDHFLGWVPGAEGRQAGLTFFDNAGVPHATHPLAPDYQGCGHPDPDHSYEGGRVEYNGGACDGWLRAGQNDDYAIGYYVASDLAFLSRAAPDWTVGDHYFASIMAATFPNRMYQHAAQTDRLHNTFELSTLPTIWDRLAERGLTGRYYFNDAPFLGLWGLKYASISRLYPSFLDDCAAGTLPHVSYVDPRFVQEPTGTTNDDHPHGDIRNGEAFMNEVYTAVTRSPAWMNTVLVINFDEWGGFFDHVPPPSGPIPTADQAAGNTDGLFGFRVPLFVISPFARRKTITPLVLDHTSILRLIEWRWDLAPLTVRDATATNLAEALDFAKSRRQAPHYPVPPGPFGAPCPNVPLNFSGEWRTVVELARSYGWSI
ncbi:MAG: phospholipase [Acidobacteria bacterium]|nr:MAG: phospholipase [Acidobacteriota bacterium]